MQNLSTGIKAIAASAAIAGGASFANADFYTQTSNSNFLPSSAEQINISNLTGLNFSAPGSANFSVFEVMATGSQISISPTSASYSNPLCIFAFNDQARGILGYNGIVANDFTFNIPTTAGQRVTLAFGHWGMEPTNNGTPIFSSFNFGVNSPLNNLVFNQAGGDNQFGSEAHSVDISGATGVPAPGAVALLGLAGLVATRRRR